MIQPPDGEKSWRICLAVSTEYRRVTDRQIDRHLAAAAAAAAAPTTTTTTTTTTVPTTGFIQSL